MGLGLFSLLGIGVIKLIGKGVEAYRDAETEARTKDEDTYRLYSKGGFYSTKNGHPCSYGRVSEHYGKYYYPQDEFSGAKDGDWVLRDAKTKIILRNYTKEKRDAEQKAIADDLKELEDAVAAWKARQENNEQ